MPTKTETIVTLSNTHAQVEYPNGVVLSVTADGDVTIRKGTDVFGYSPSRLRKNTTTVFQTGESEGSQRFALDGKTTLNIKTERSERLSVEVFFHETTEEGVAVSGCFVTKYNDWGINFVNSDKFLLNLDRLFAL